MIKYIPGLPPSAFASNQKLESLGMRVVKVQEFLFLDRVGTDGLHEADLPPRIRLPIGGGPQQI